MEKVVQLAENPVDKGDGDKYGSNNQDAAKEIFPRVPQFKMRSEPGTARSFGGRR